MSGKRPEGAGSSPLLLAAALAVALHALLLSFVHLRQARQAAPVLLRSRDNTAELLQFASLPPAVTPLERLPLPTTRSLPPPPVLPTLAHPSRGTGEKGRPSRLAKGSRAKPPQRPAGGTVQAGPGSAQGGGARPAAERDRAGAGEAAVEQLQAFLRAEPPPSAGGELPPSREAYQALWTLARPSLDPDWLSAISARKLALEVRQLSLRQARASGAPILHRQVVVLPEHVLLVWLEGETVYLLQAPRQQTPGSQG